IKRREYAAAVSGIVSDPGFGVHSIGCAVLASSRCRLRFGGGLGKRRGHEHPDFPFNPARSDPDGEGSCLTQTTYAKASRVCIFRRNMTRKAMFPKLLRGQPRFLRPLIRRRRGAEAR